MELDLTRIFIKVVQNGSFSRAAELLKIPKSTVSKAVSRLENETGTKLLVRTTRSLSLTASGRAFYDTCLAPITILEDAAKSLSGKDSILSGLVRLTAPEDLGAYAIAPAIADLVNKHPGLSFEFEYTDKIVDLVKDGFDLAVRIGKLRETNFRAKKVGEFSLGLVASAKYLKSHEKIRSPKDLASHNCLSYSDPRFLTRWPLKSAKSFEQPPITPRITSNQMSSLMAMAIEHAGVAYIPLYIAHREIAAGRLVRVLPDWKSPGLPVSIVSPLASSTSARLKITHECITSAIRKIVEA